jgi:hypothetical protein
MQFSIFGKGRGLDFTVIGVVFTDFDLQQYHSIIYLPSSKGAQPRKKLSWIGGNK